eukprot:CAMPEP_0172544862 /NCGR_PEP_ID=MMETSP1067-20121228/14914_1 /TAXON_ID=265564 ORGANISM="Thalassiosira punctigera, Strain Tpunct2005C2" /NCGR_SAMPLE_ID=MMETSP1067 /ASSEMBLY_ACC=CAM_ASM_000444 /LENGTH=131 /DNA_ID=CAMNT_0013331497 /DNA_START=700 /DNA_END=1096 /DNA_ORIENTATION=+
MTRVIEERVCKIEKERLNSMEAPKNEYEKLEARLRKALVEVEGKERQLKDTELGYQNEQKRRLVEIEQREKLMKEELKHSLEIEDDPLGLLLPAYLYLFFDALFSFPKCAKVTIAVDQAVAVEKIAVLGKK